MLTLLMKLGLSEKEARVYLALLELANDTAIKIAAKAKLPRATTYVILSKLMEMGLVSQVTEAGRTLFVAEDPHELDRILDMQIKEIEQKRTSLGESIQQLVALYNRQQDKPVVRYYEGVEGLKALDRYAKDDPRTTQEKVVYGFANFDALQESFPARRKEAVDERIKAGIWSKTIYTKEAGPLPEGDNAQQLRESVWLPKEYLPFKGSIACNSWSVRFYEFGGSKPMGILIEDERTATMMVALIKLAWIGSQTVAKDL